MTRRETILIVLMVVTAFVLGLVVGAEYLP